MHSQKSRHRRQIFFFIFLIAAYFIFVAVFWAVIHSPLFRIKNIEITGNKNVSNEDIMTLVKVGIYRDSLIKRILGMRNILIWPKNFSGDILKFYPELKSVSIQKNYLERKIRIVVEEKQPFGVWCLVTRPNDNRIKTNDNRILDSDSIFFDENSSDNTACFWFDSDGIIFKKAIEVEGNLIISLNDYSQKSVGLNRKILPDQLIANIFSIFMAVSQSGLRIKEMRLNDLSLEEMEVDTYDGLPTDLPAESSLPGLRSDYGGVGKAGPKIYFSLRFPADNVPDIINSLKEKSVFGGLQYVDFRVENRVYYK